MERLLTILGILATIIGLSIAGIIYAADTRDKLFVEIDAAITACEQDDIETLKEKSKAMSDLTKERHGILSLYVRHGEIEKLETLLVKIDGYTRTGEMNDAAVTLMEARFMTENIYLRERLSISNLF